MTKLNTLAATLAAAVGIAGCATTGQQGSGFPTLDGTPKVAGVKWNAPDDLEKCKNQYEDYKVKTQKPSAGKAANNDIISIDGETVFVIGTAVAKTPPKKVNRTAPADAPKAVVMACGTVASPHTETTYLRNIWGSISASVTGTAITGAANAGRQALSRIPIVGNILGAAASGAGQKGTTIAKDALTTEQASAAKKAFSEAQGDYKTIIGAIDLKVTDLKVGNTNMMVNATFDYSAIVKLANMQPR